MTEVIQQTEFIPRCFQVIEHLTAMSVIKFGNSFNLHYDTIVANEVGTISLLKFLPIIVNLQFLLPLERYATFSKLQGKGLLVYSLEEPYTQGIIHFHCRPGDEIRLMIEVYHNIDLLF